MSAAREPLRQNAVTLVSFLGTGNYQSVAYRLGDQTVHSRYFARAAAQLYGVAQVRVLATDAAKHAHEPGLKAAFADLPGVDLEFVAIREGKNTGELWELFEVLVAEMKRAQPGLILDITHGYRSLPFFAAAATAYLRALEALPDEMIVTYGGFEARDAHEVAPVWELTAFLDLLDWAHGVSVFTTTGLADPLLAVFRRQNARQKRRLAHGGARRFPRTDALSGAIERFADDFLTVRIAAMVCGDGQGKSGGRSSAVQLQEAVTRYGDEAGALLPALRPLLDRIERFSSGLAAESLFGPDADRALRRLARRYLEQKRYAEAAITLREAWVSRYATDPAQTNAGQAVFDPQRRSQAEADWTKRCEAAKTIADVRNDIQHGGFRKRPKPAATLRDQTAELVRELDDTAGERIPDPAPESGGTTT